MLEWYKREETVLFVTIPSAGLVEKTSLKMPVPQVDLKVQSLNILHRILTILEISKIKSEQMEDSHRAICHLNCLEKLVPSRSFRLHICLIKQIIQIVNESSSFSPSEDFFESLKDVRNCSFESFFDIQTCLEKHGEIDSQPIN